MPTVSKCQGGNSKPGLTHSKIHWLQKKKKICGYRKKRSLTTEPGTVRGPPMPCQPSVGSLSPTYPSWPAVLPSPWPGSENTPGAQRSKGREELVTPLAQWQPAAHSIRAKPRAREVDTSGTDRASYLVTGPGPEQEWEAKRRLQFQSQDFIAGKRWKVHLIQNIHLEGQETEDQERQGPTLGYTTVSLKGKITSLYLYCSW